MARNQCREPHRKTKSRGRATSDTSERDKVLSVGRKASHGPFRCDWCHEVKPEIRRSGARICNDCWNAYRKRQEADAKTEYGRILQQTFRNESTKHKP